MAGYKGHLAGGWVVFAAYMFGMGLILAGGDTASELDMRGWSTEMAAYVGVMLVVATLFSLWPDVDTDSKGQRLFYTVFFIVDVWLLLEGEYKAAAYLGLFAILPGMHRHRGWTHTWWAMLLIPLPIALIPYWQMEPSWIGIPVYGAAVSGYLSHLVIDGTLIPKRKWS